MASTLLTLLDDIATLLDDVAVLSKKAATKTAGVLGDDLALNAEQVNGVKASRELPVVWAVFKGSMFNKLILVPVALFISWIAPFLVVPLLMLGGAFLCYEGAEKVLHKLFHQKEAVDEGAHRSHLEAIANPDVDMVSFERDKIKGAVRTDFVLSAEVIVITLGAVAAASFMHKVFTLIVIAVMMTVVVYGFVAAIVKLDDIGLHLSKKEGRLKSVGLGLLVTAPYFMKLLSIVGTAAMFLVGGEILMHGISPLEHWINQVFSYDGILSSIGKMACNGVLGLTIGSFLVGAHSLIGKLR